MTKPLVWFERPLMAEVRDMVIATVEPLIPASLAEAPYQHLEQAVGAMVGTLPFDGAHMDRAPHLEVIARTGIGVDGIDIDAATQRGIAVCNAPDGPTVSTAEHTVAMMLAATKLIRLSSARLSAGEPNLYQRHDAVQLAGKRLGLIGYGRISRRVAHIASAMDMEISAYDPYIAEFTDGVNSADSIAALLADADIVSVHVPLNDSTRSMCDASFFGAMKEGAVFVNTARGGLVDQAALYTAVDGGHLLAAALDVTDPEPLPTDHQLLHHPSIIVTPHIASGTPEARLGNFAGAFEAVTAVLEGVRPTNLINPTVWERRKGAAE